MRTRYRLTRLRAESQAGFTLIEILIVVILLGILATIIIPQVSVSTDDAKLNTLKTSLNNIRGAVELYYYQHSNKYPGQIDPTDGDGAPGDAAAAFVAQLTLYTSEAGATATSKDGTYKYGPYLKEGMPTNPYNDVNTVVADNTTNNITAKSSSGTNKGWKFYTQTGVLLPDDGDHDTF